MLYCQVIQNSRTGPLRNLAYRSRFLLPRQYRISLHRTCKQITLGHIAIQLLQQLKLLRGFHTFGHHFHA